MSPTPSAQKVAAQPVVVRRQVNLFDLQRQKARIGQEIEDRIDHVLDHGQFILGPEVTALEESLAEFAGVKHAIGVSSGRDAIIMMLMAIEAGPGDAVFVPAFTFSATAGTVVSVGASPVFVDVDPRTFNMDLASLEAAIEKVKAEGKLKLHAIMPVDLYGLPADYDAIRAIAEKHGMVLVSDAAQSFGGEAGGLQVGNLAPISATSFYPTKPLGCYGDGGAVFTDDDDLAAAVREIRNHGRAGDGDDAIRLGMTGRLDTIQAAVLQVKLQAFPDELTARRRLAKRYDERLAGLVDTPLVPEGSESAWALYTVRVKNRDTVRAALQEQGVGTGLFYKIPLHRHPAFREWVRDDIPLPVSEALADDVISLPIHADLTDDELDYVVEQFRQAIV
ncbi:MAG: DegT/DnrJ/EryC1/StrS family aminotransferase [Pseudomonadota bacterium]